MNDVLAEICAVKRDHVRAKKATRGEADLLATVGGVEAPRGFAAALRRAMAVGGFGLIAEIKKASPSRGVIRADFDPAALARAYAAGGATCLSVLTDAPYFQGDDAYLGAARAAVALPCLRKDFMLDPYQVVEARALGADCILVILAAVDDALGSDLVRAAHELGMDVLAEAHDANETERALKLDADLIGINNRDLKTLKVDLTTTERLAAIVPPDRVLVAESGLEAHADLERLALVGARAFLVGESLMRAGDVAAATRALLGRAA